MVESGLTATAFLVGCPSVLAGISFFLVAASVDPLANGFGIKTPLPGACPYATGQVAETRQVTNSLCSNSEYLGNFGGG